MKGIFDDVARQWLKQSRDFRSANGCYSPSKYLMKPKVKIITKPLRPVPIHKLKAWRANHQQAMRYIDKVNEKLLPEYDMQVIRRFMQETFTRCSSRAVNMVRTARLQKETR